jgi:uncharacterized protein HemX
MSKEAMNTMSLKMTSTFSDSTAFTTAMKSAMKTNGVTSVAVDDITSDTSSVPANAGTTGATVSNNNNNNNNDANNNNSDGKTDLVLIVVVVVLLVVIGLSCAGGYMFAKSQQAKKKKKNPENLYELKNFTQKRPTVEIFEMGGAMNSTNPLADVGVGNA